jgi:hypothetical protein
VVDKSVSKWETQGLGMDIEAIERGLEEARRLAGVEGEANKGKEREARGSRTAEMAAQEKIPGKLRSSREGGKAY